MVTILSGVSCSCFDVIHCIDEQCTQCTFKTKQINPYSDFGLLVSQEATAFSKSRFRSAVSLHYIPGVYATAAVTLSLSNQSEKLSILYHRLILRNRLLKALHWDDGTGRRLQLAWLTKRPHENESQRHTLEGKKKKKFLKKWRM